jgi:hypothetical protein
VHGITSSSSNDDSGVFGENNGGGNGVQGTTSSSTAFGVLGENTSAGGGGIGTIGGSGVYGQASGENSAGVYGLSQNTQNGVGVAADGPLGVYALGGMQSWYGKGIEVQFSTGPYAGTFYGPVFVVGYLTKAGGGFKIDHPTDPANKYLSHSFVESPDMKNVYDGVVELSAKGEATVRLPNWFEALNRDFRYQLTAIGGPAPNLHIAQGVRRNTFKIAGGKHRMKVSWQVTGIRQDQWAEKNRVVVESKKPRVERGFYLHPEAHDKPEEKGVRWAHDPEYMTRMKSALTQRRGAAGKPK